MIDRKQAESAFFAYTSRYDPDNPMIRHKVEHTLRVAANCERIAASLRVGDEDVAFAWLLGLLHDIGRFEQVCRYGTFVDSVSVDHAEFGADLLFRDGLIHEFPVQGLATDRLNLLETAIRLHNKLTLPEDLDETARCFCDLIRDADKADIFRVVTELSFEERAGTSKGLLQETEGACDAVTACSGTAVCRGMPGRTTLTCGFPTVVWRLNWFIRRAGRSFVSRDTSAGWSPGAMLPGNRCTARRNAGRCAS